MSVIITWCQLALLIVALLVLVSGIAVIGFYNARRCGRKWTVLRGVFFPSFSTFDPWEWFFAALVVAVFFLLAIVTAMIGDGRSGWHASERGGHEITRWIRTRDIVLKQ